MSSSEEYLDSLLDSILGGGKPGEEETAFGTEGGENQTPPADGGKAMSPEEIEEMLVSMGTLGSAEEEPQEQTDSEAEDMEAMLAFMNEHNAGVSDSDGGELSLDDLGMEEGAASDDFALEEMDAGESGSDDAAMDGLSLDDLDLGENDGDSAVIDELSPGDLSLDDLNLGESDDGDAATDGLSLDDLDLGENGGDDAAIDELSLDDLSLDDLGMEESAASDDFALEETDAGEGMPDGMDGLSLDGLDFGESDGGDADMDGLSLDDLDLGESDSGDADMDGLSLDDLDLGENGGDDTAIDGLSLDDLSLDDLGMEEGTASDDFALEETDAGEGMPDGMDGLSLDDLDLGESDSGDADMDGLSLDDLDLGENGSDDAASDDLALEESEDAEGEMDGLMSEEDIDRLLNGDLSDGEGGADDFALEETGESDEDLSSLLAGMDHDEDLSEINDLLEGADQGVSPDDDILAMLEGADDGGDGSFDFFENDEAAREAESIRELTPEEIAAREGGEKPKKEKKKRKKLFGKKKKESGEESAAEELGDELEALLGTTAEEEPGVEEEEAKEKKPGFFARLMDFLLETDEDEDPVAAEVLADNAGETGTVTDENREILEELKEEDKKGKKKKKKDKKKGKKGKGGEEGEEAAEGEEDEKKAKKKKKKEKKKKEEEEVDLFAPPEKKLSKKKVITVFVFCGTIAACIVLLSSFLPNYTEKRGAHVAYDHQDYAEVFDLLYGKTLNEEEEILFQRSNLILQMNRKLTSYENYVNLNMRLEALNALISGVARYQEILPDAETYNVVGEVSDIYAQILERLAADFGVSESDALDIIASEDDVTYSQRLDAIINGAVYGEDVPEGRQDVLPEEEEIIERIDGIEDGLEEDVPGDMSADEMQGDDTSAEGAGEDMPADENVDEGAE